MIFDFKLDLPFCIVCIIGRVFPQRRSYRRARDATGQGLIKFPWIIFQQLQKITLHLLHCSFVALLVCCIIHLSCFTFVALFICHVIGVNDVEHASLL